MFPMKSMSQSEIVQYVIKKVNDDKCQQLFFIRTNILFKFNKTLDSLLDRIEGVMRDIKIKSYNNSKTKNGNISFYWVEQQQDGIISFPPDVCNTQANLHSR